MILVYVNDILISGDSDDDVQGVISLLKTGFKLKYLGQVSYFLGIEVCKSGSKFSLSQKKYISDLLVKTKMTECNECATPVVPLPKLSQHEGQVFRDSSLYRSVVGSLQYLTLSRPDIAFSVNKLSQHLHNPTSLHWNACKRLLRYLKGTISFVLEFHPAACMALEGFADADWASCQDGRRSTGGHCVFLGENLVVWNAKKQDVVSKSSAESQYRSLSNLTFDIVWLDSLCAEIGVKLSAPHKVWCDNTSAISLASNPVFHAPLQEICE